MTVRVTEILEEMLLLTKKGEITAIAIATLGPDLSTGSTFTLGEGTLAELLGAIRMMEHRIISSSEEGTLD